MKKSLVAAIALSALGCMGLASAEPVKMTDNQLTDVTYDSHHQSGDHQPQCVYRRSHGSLVVGCAAVNAPVLSGNIVGTIAQTATATATSGK